MIPKFLNAKEKLEVKELIVLWTQVIPSLYIIGDTSAKETVPSEKTSASEETSNEENKEKEEVKVEENPSQ